MKKIFLFFLLGLGSLEAQSNLYFPPLSGSTWDRTAPEDLGWCRPALDSLYSYLDSTNTKAFLILKDGRLVVEEYFGSFAADSSWYWASAGKTIQAFLTGQLQEQGLLSIEDPSSQYLGSGWTSASTAQEDSILIRHQLSMTTGLDFTRGNLDCTDDSCLHYLNPAGSEWYYHNAPYTLLDSVLRQASGLGLNALMQREIKSRTGMTGLWFQVGYNNVYFSTARSMARFGLLMLAGGRWEQDSLLRDRTYFQALTSPSQSSNPAYGYLWWLNGQSSFGLPGSTLRLPGSLFPSAPTDMYAALGRDDQKIYVVPSEGLVIVRMGESAGGPSLASSSFDNQVWEKLNTVFAGCATALEAQKQPVLQLYPNPCSDILFIEGSEQRAWKLYSLQGQVLREGFGEGQVPVGDLPQGAYLFCLFSESGELLHQKKLLKN